MKFLKLSLIHYLILLMTIKLLLIYKQRWLKKLIYKHYKKILIIYNYLIILQELYYLIKQGINYKYQLERVVI